MEVYISQTLRIIVYVLIIVCDYWRSASCRTVLPVWTVILLGRKRIVVVSFSALEKPQLVRQRSVDRPRTAHVIFLYICCLHGKSHNKNMLWGNDYFQYIDYSISLTRWSNISCINRSMSVIFAIDRKSRVGHFIRNYNLLYSSWRIRLFCAWGFPWISRWLARPWAIIHKRDQNQKSEK